MKPISGAVRGCRRAIHIICGPSEIHTARETARPGDQRARLAALKKPRKAIHLTTHTSVSLSSSHIFSGFYSVSPPPRALTEPIPTHRERRRSPALICKGGDSRRPTTAGRFISTAARYRSTQKRTLSSEKVHHSLGTDGRQRGHKYSCVHCV